MCFYLDCKGRLPNLILYNTVLPKKWDKTLLLNCNVDWTFKHYQYLHYMFCSEFAKCDCHILQLRYDTTMSVFMSQYSRCMRVGLGAGPRGRIQWHGKGPSGFLDTSSPHDWDILSPSHTRQSSCIMWLQETEIHVCVTKATTLRKHTFL